MFKHTLLNHGFSRFVGKKIVSKDEEIGNVYMGENTDKFFTAKAKNDLIATVEKGNNGNLEKKIVIKDMKDQYQAGETVGKCEVYLGDNKVGEVDIYSDRDVKKPNIFEKAKFKVKNMFGKSEEK